MYEAQYPRGVPFKNFLITDPVRQTYVWKNLAIDSYRKLELPLWNPYEMSGKPLMGNLQGGVFYPLNIVFAIQPFALSWTIFIILQSLLAGFFMYVYLKSLKLTKASSLLGSVSFMFSSFAVVWLEWGNIVHIILWLPVILLSIDKLIYAKRKHLLIWSGIYIFSVLSSFFAGHIQIFFYVISLSLLYFVTRLQRINLRLISLFIGLNVIALVVSFVQWYSTLQFIVLSARNVDQNYTTIDGWFVPLQQF